MNDPALIKRSSKHDGQNGFAVRGLLGLENGEDMNMKLLLIYEFRISRNPYI